MDGDGDVDDMAAGYKFSSRELEALPTKVRRGKDLMRFVLDKGFRRPSETVGNET